MTEPPEDLDVDFVHDGIRVSVRPYIVDSLRPGMPRTIAVTLVGLAALVPVAVLLPILNTLTFILCWLGLMLASMILGRAQHIRALRASRVGLVVYMQPHALTLEWSRDGLPSHIDRVDPQDVAAFELFDAGFRIPEVRIKLNKGQVTLPLHGCSLAEAEWIVATMTDRVEEGRKLLTEGADEVPGELLSMMKSTDPA